jgi:hypothetical protein
MNKKLAIAISVIIVLFCASLVDASSMNYKVSLSDGGKVQIKGVEGIKIPATMPQYLNGAVMVNVMQGTLSIVECTGGKIDSQTKPVGNVLIKDGCPDLKGGGGKGEIISYRKGGDEEVAYLISPRYSIITTSDPIIRWHHLKEIDSYQVSLYRGTDKSAVWTRSISLADYPSKKLHNVEIIEMKYPDCIDNSCLIKEGLDYYIQVTGQSKARSISSEELLLNPDQYPPMEGFGTRISNSGDLEFRLTRPSNTESNSTVDDAYLLIGSLAKKNMFYDAIQKNEELAQQEKNAFRTRQLGDLYLENGLNQIAENVYEEAEKYLVKISDPKQKAEERELLESSLQNLKQARASKRDN